MKEFRRAVEARDLAALTSLLAPDIEFCSPVTHKTYHGRDVVGFILATVAQVFTELTYVDELEEGARSILRFRVRIGDRDGEGVDMIERNAAGLVQKLTVAIRPLSALQALAEAMRARLAPGAG
jgi:SnoaL-like domain